MLAYNNQVFNLAFSYVSPITKKIIRILQDYGIGILQKNLSKLFGRFYRGDAENSSMPGFGVGLYICSEIIHRHRGSIWEESEPGKGSVFYFQIPKNYN